MTAPHDPGDPAGRPRLGPLLAPEARTPLNAIRGLAELLLAGGAGPLGLDALAHVAAIAAAARRLEGAVAALIEPDGAEPAAGRDELPLAPLLIEAGFAPGAAAACLQLTVRDAARWRRLLGALRGGLSGGLADAPGGLGAELQANGALVELRLTTGLGPDGLGQAERALARHLAGRLGVAMTEANPDANPDAGAVRVVLAWAPA